MKARDIMKGRSFAGTPIAKSGIRPPSRTGSASGNFVGTGVNRKSAARPETTPSRSNSSAISGTQLEAVNRQAPEPFRNPAPGAKLNLGTPQQSGGPNRAYKAFRGTRISIPDGNNNSKAAGVGKGANTGYPGGNLAAVGITGNRGRGRVTRKVAGNPTFYGR